MTTTTEQSTSTLDPVTFEVLKNAFATSVDLMSEQILRTCYSFVIYSRDFSSALCDRYGNTVMQGSADIAVHVGTLHFQCKAVMEEFGDDINPGDVFLINDPYRGGTHFNDVSFIRPIFADDEIIGFASRYDPQLFHIDPEAAKASNFKGLAASGWHTASASMRMLVDHFIPPKASMGSPGIDELRWVQPVRPQPSNGSFGGSRARPPGSHESRPK